MKIITWLKTHPFTAYSTIFTVMLISGILLYPAADNSNQAWMLIFLGCFIIVNFLALWIE